MQHLRAQPEPQHPSPTLAAALSLQPPSLTGTGHFPSQGCPTWQLWDRFLDTPSSVYQVLGVVLWAQWEDREMREEGTRPLSPFGFQRPKQQPDLGDRP